MVAAVEEESVPLPPLPAGQGSQNEACGADGGVPMKKFAEGWIPAHVKCTMVCCVCLLNLFETFAPAVDFVEIVEASAQKLRNHRMLI